MMLYVVILFIASKIAHGSWLPLTTTKGLWFYSGLASLLLGSLIVTPFYTKPADAISYAVAGLVSLMATNLWNNTSVAPVDRAIWAATMTYVVAVLSSGIVSIVLKDTQHVVAQRLSRTLFSFCESVGGPRSIFSALFLFALVSFHRDSLREFVTVGLAWALLVGLRPFEVMLDLFRKIHSIWNVAELPQAFGEVVAYQTPDIALIKQASEATVPFGSLLSVPREDGTVSVALAADYVGWHEGRWLRAFMVVTDTACRNALSLVLPSGRGAMSGFLLPSENQRPQELRDLLRASRLVSEHHRLVGLVAPETDISSLRFEVVRTDLDIYEGRLVEVQIGAHWTLYQIVNGLTKEEILQQKNLHGFVRADAKKIGVWNASQQGFEMVKWVPSLNSPVFLMDEQSYKPRKEAIGHFPGTDYSVQLDLNMLVTHNAAILGILGSGKSFLALELVERLVQERIKVICLDLTNQYASELKPLYDSEVEKTALAQMARVGAGGKNNVQQNVEEGGSILQFAEEVKKDLLEFLKDGTKCLKIYNPAAFEVWRQDSRPFSGKASMATLTPTEITRIIVERLLELLRDKMSDRARACIVFEEAHSLVPEWSAVASDGDKAATNGTAKAILQGRKYGLGCIIVTQRTANVTKSILNQCNTVFALRVFDATGMEFLKNYIGEDYAAFLSTLEDRRAVVFGRASSCRNPVLVRLNDRNQFLDVFRPQPKPNAAPGSVF